jgi:peptidyl-prolyl cis-trans isomerase D
VTDYKPSTVPSFDAVKDAVRVKVVAEQAAAMAKKEGEAKLAALQASKSTDGFTSPIVVSRNDAQGLPATALSAIFKANAAKLPAYVGVDLGADGYAIYRVNGIEKAAAVAADRLTGAQQQISQVYAQADMEAYVNALKARSKVKLSTAPTPAANQ